ncbi:MFS transporter [Amycolatopsis anabasis]|uniref:MFS transporter n=1 Tax=Amycolatopsis anabasis TaxID=1840409 RepID=UPI001FE90BF6|nr:MFS transporter [Amycolatopsis anabasis]
MITEARRGGLLRHRDFRQLWLADALSQFGSRIQVLALPLLAATTLHASALQVSLLRTLETLAYLVIGLQVGAWCDRLRCRPLLLAADLGRTVVLASVPVVAAFGVLTLGQLFAVVATTGVLSVFFDVARPSYLPRLVGREHLLEANARLETNRSMAAVAAPAPAGYLVQVFGGPAAIAVNALSFLWSAWWLRRIRTPDPRPVRAERPRLWREIGEGLRLVFGHPILRAIGLNAAVLSLFQSGQIAINVVFLLREIHLSPGIIGVLSTSTLVGAVLGALCARWIGLRLGQARGLWVSGIVIGLAYLLFPLTGPGWALAWYVVAGLATSFGIIVLSVLAASFQQAVTPERLLGRMNATIRFLLLGPVPLGSLLGGVLAGTLGLRATLWVAGAGVFASAGFLVFSPLRRSRALPRECESAEPGSREG